MITYLVRQDSNYLFTVSKWDMGVRPIEVYRVETGKNDKMKCNCASGSHRGYCKHTDMVKAWVKRGCPMEEITA